MMNQLMNQLRKILATPSFPFAPLQTTDLLSKRICDGVDYIAYISTLVLEYVKTDWELRPSPSFGVSYIISKKVSMDGVDYIHAQAFFVFLSCYIFCIHASYFSMSVKLIITSSMIYLL
jgi:hypothetical protein